MNFRHTRWPLYLAVVLFGLWTLPSSATVMRFADLARLVEISDMIVQGKVVDARTYRSGSDGQVVTDTTVEVSRSFYGKSERRVTFQQWGGAFEGSHRVIPGDASFEQGEEVVVFLHNGGGDGYDPEKSGGLYLSALGQAKFRVVRDDEDVRVERDLEDMVFMEDGAGVPGTMVIRPSEAIELPSFVAELESLVAGIKGSEVRR
jgi:hypothetical protein